MSISSMGDLVYTIRFLSLFNMRFSQWRAHRHGIIDRDGNKVREPETPNEKRAWTKLHVLIANIKKAFHMLPGGQSVAATAAASVAALMESNDPGLQELAREVDPEFRVLLNEAMVTGDATGAPNSGETTGAFVKPGLNRLFQHAGSRDPMSYIEWLRKQKQMRECAAAIQSSDPVNQIHAANTISEMFATEEGLEEFISHF